MRKIKVWGGVHVDEVEALKCVDTLIETSIPNVDGEIADPLNRLRGRRTHLCCMLPGNLKSKRYLVRRAAEVVLSSQGNYGNIDLHNINYMGENTAVLSPERGVSRLMLGMLLGDLGIRNLVATEHGLPICVPNTLVLETVASGLGRDHQTLHSAFNTLANDTNPKTADATEFSWFAPLTALHIDQVSPKTLTQSVRNNLEFFKPLPQDFVTQIGFEGVPACLMSWRHEPNENGYWAELVTPITTPSTSSWPR